jgi:23S rRNA pseudouridine2605 synthase
MDQDNNVDQEEVLVSRREYLLSLKKWSKVVVGGVLLSSLSSCSSSWGDSGWNDYGGGWLDSPSSWGNGWSNNSGRGSWVNTRGESGWSNSGGGSWTNTRGGSSGGGNRSGGGSRSGGGGGRR